MQMSVHQCKQMRIHVRAHPEAQFPFALLRLVGAKDDSIVLYFESVREIFTFAERIQDEVMRVKREGITRVP